MALTPPSPGQVWQVDPSGIGLWTDPNADPRSQLYNFLGQTANDASRQSGGTALQQLLSQGYLDVSPGGDNGPGSYELGPNAPASLSTMFRPQGISGADKAINPSLVTNDPTYGSVTDTRNIYHEGEHDFMARYGQPIMESLLGIGFGGLVSAFGGGLGGLGNTLFKGLGSEILSGGANPLSSLQNLFSRSSGGAGGTASQLSPLLSILSLLGRLGKGGTTPS